MDQDLNELEQLAEGTHADLQEKPKKQADRERNGLPTDPKQGLEAISSTDVMTQATQHSASGTLASEKQAASVKQAANRASLQEQQMSSKVNQDLFYQGAQDQDGKEHSPDQTKDSKAPPEPVPDFGTPLKGSKSEEGEGNQEQSENSPMIEDVAAKVEVKGKAVEKFGSLEEEFEAIDKIDPTVK